MSLEVKRDVSGTQMERESGFRCDIESYLSMAAQLPRLTRVGINVPMDYGLQGWDFPDRHRDEMRQKEGYLTRCVVGLTTATTAYPAVLRLGESEVYEREGGSDGSLRCYYRLVPVDRWINVDP